MVIWLFRAKPCKVWLVYSGVLPHLPPMGPRFKSYRGALCVLGYSVPTWLRGFSLEQFSEVFLPLLKLKFPHCLLTLSRCWKGFDKYYHRCRSRCRSLPKFQTNFLSNHPIKSLTVKTLYFIQNIQIFGREVSVSASTFSFIFTKRNISFD